MIVRNVTRTTLETVCEKIGHITLHELRPANKKGTAWRFTLRPKSKDNYYGRVSPFSGRKVHAVCWHGHRDFLQKLFAEQPDAIVVTSLARYDGEEDFNAKFPGTQYTNIGSEYRPATILDGCDCTCPF